MDPIIVDTEKEEQLLAIKELAEHLGVNKPTIQTWKKEVKLPFHRLGRRVYF